MILLIIQARMGSQRLPGKVLKDVSGKPLLEQMINRISPAKTINKIVVATSTAPSDDAIEHWCKNNNVDCFRGSENDVLDRFYHAANSYSNVKTVVRICADNPLHSHKVVDFVVNRYLHSGADYFSNSNHEPDFLEDGFDTEVFSMKALESACKEATLPSEREHVTPYIKNCGKFKCQWEKVQAQYSFKLSVDTQADLLAVTRIFEELKSIPDFSIEEVTSLLLAKPEILQINKDSKINEGYKSSLAKDIKSK